MTETQGLKAEACAVVDRRGRQLIGVAGRIARYPELGFKETRTARLVAETLGRLGLQVKTGLAVTGVQATLKPEGPRPTVAILSELDALVCREHPQAHARTGVVHACGHNLQVASMLGVAMALVESGVAASLDGNVAFLATPAEEYVDIEDRLDLRRRGELEFIGGKPELIRLGEFAPIDMALLVHAGGAIHSVGGGANGFIAKSVRFVGREAHAGSAPQTGVNALNAANIAIHAIHAQRETFREEDRVRIHPILTRAGDSVNIVPADVRLETYIRAARLEAITGAALKVDRSLRAGAMAVGARLEVTDLPGFLPLVNDSRLAELYRTNLVSLVGRERVVDGGHMTGSTDMGDLSQVMPVLQAYSAGVAGTAHTRDFAVVDWEQACLVPAKAMAMTAIDLLAGGAAGARHILATAKPAFTQEEYVARQRGLWRYWQDGPQQP